MKVWKHYAFWLLLSATLGASSAVGQIVDRMVANVNGHVLLQSDWEEELAFEAFLDARSADSFSSEERKAALDRLIDQELLREEVRPSEETPADQIAARVTEVRKLHPEAATDDGWRGALQRYGLTQTDLETRLGQSIQLMRLVEARLRPSIQIDQKAVESYYQEQLLPELKKAGSREVALPEVFGRIRDLIGEEAKQARIRFSPQQNTVGGIPIPPGATGFLVELLYRLGQRQVNHRSNGRLIDSETESNRPHEHSHLIRHPALLIPAPILRLHLGMVWNSLNAFAR